MSGSCARSCSISDARLCFDRRRVYAVGHSNGGFLAHRLACEAADLFAAVGSVAGCLGIDDCAPARPIPVLQMHGTADPLVAYGGGGILGHPAADDNAAAWAARNGCVEESVVGFQEDDVTCREWQDCDDGATVTLCSFEGMGHCWPGNPACAQGSPSTTTHASETFAEFFLSHELD